VSQRDGAAEQLTTSMDVDGKQSRARTEDPFHKFWRKNQKGDI